MRIFNEEAFLLFGDLPTTEAGCRAAKLET